MYRTRRFVMVFLFTGFLFVGQLGLGCSTSNVSNPESPSGPNSEGQASLWLQARAHVGDRYRTKRTLVAFDFLPDGRKITSMRKESFIQEILEVNSFEDPLRVRRLYENQLTVVKQPGQEEKQSIGQLEGVEVELAKQSESIKIHVLSGDPPAEALNDLFIQGIDSEMLPINPVRRGDIWEVDIQGRPRLQSLLLKLGLNPEKNLLKAKLLEQSASEVRIALEWKISGWEMTSQHNKPTPVHYQLTGELVFDLEGDFIRSLSIYGGRLNAAGEVLLQLSITLQREKLKGWYS